MGKDKVRNEILEDTIKFLENNNKELTETNREQFRQIEHCQRQLQDLQHQLEECRSSLNRAMFCYEMEYENNQLYKDLLQVPPNTFLWRATFSNYKMPVGHPIFFTATVSGPLEGCQIEFIYFISPIYIVL